MNPENIPYYSMEFIEEDGRLYVQFYNDKDEPVAKREIPRDMTIESFVRSNLLGDN